MHAPRDDPLMTDPASRPAIDPYAPYPTTNSNEPPMRWNIVFGVVSLAVGVLGMCMQAMVVGSLAIKQILGLFGMEVSSPPALMVWAGGFQAVINTALGVLLIVGSWKLIMRKPAGVRLVRTWVVARLVTVCIGFAATLITIKPQVEWSVTLQGEIREALRKNPQIKEKDLPPLIDQEAAQKQALWSIGIFTAAFAVWPLVMGYVLSRSRVKTDVEAWEAAIRAGS